jgi:hypothetical protein
VLEGVEPLGHTLALVLLASLVVGMAADMLTALLMLYPDKFFQQLQLVLAVHL